MLVENLDTNHIVRVCKEFENSRVVVADGDGSYLRVGVQENVVVDVHHVIPNRLVIIGKKLHRSTLLKK